MLTLRFGFSWAVETLFEDLFQVAVSDSYSYPCGGVVATLDVVVMYLYDQQGIVFQRGVLGRTFGNCSELELPSH